MRGGAWWAPLSGVDVVDGAVGGWRGVEQPPAATITVSRMARTRYNVTMDDRPVNRRSFFREGLRQLLARAMERARPFQEALGRFAELEQQHDHAPLDQDYHPPMPEPSPPAAESPSPPATPPPAGDPPENSR